MLDRPRVDDSLMSVLTGDCIRAANARRRVPAESMPSISFQFAALDSFGHSAARSATNSLSHFVGRTTASFTAEATRPSGGTSSTSIPC